MPAKPPVASRTGVVPNSPGSFTGREDLDAFLPGDRFAHEREQLAPALARRRMQARYAVPRRDELHQMDGNAAGIGEEVDRLSRAARHHVDDRFVRRAGGFGADVAREGRRIVLDAGFALPARAGAGKKPAAHPQVGWSVQASFKEPHARAAVRGNERAHHAGGAGADDDHVGVHPDDSRGAPSPDHCLFRPWLE